VRRALPLVLVALTACKVGPDYVAPEPVLPENWNAPAAAAEQELDPRWWTRFGDPVLEELVGAAFATSLDLRAAAERVREARAIVDIENDSNYPSVDGRVGVARRELSTSVAGGQFMPQDPNTLHSLGFDARWELDLFGHIARAVEAARAGHGVALEDARGVLQRLSAEIARNYAELRGFERELALVDGTVRLLGDAAGLVHSRADAGVVDSLDAARADALLAATQARRPSLARNRAARLHALAVLIGEFPSQTAARLEGRDTSPVAPKVIAAGLPLELVRRRPDVRRTERALAQASALTASAMTEVYPRLSLTAALGLESQDITDLFRSDSRAFNVGPRLVGPIFRNRIIEAGIEVRTAQQQQALIAHEKALLEALVDVEDALVAFARTQERVQALEASVAAERRAYDLALDLNTSGLRDYLAVLDVQRSMIAAQTDLTRARTDHVTAAVALYKALGGGWEVEAPALAGAVGAEPAQ
jgi:NodT family efflux transporter outer membrane factor (OMF) lipoprotein